MVLVDVDAYRTDAYTDDGSQLVGWAVRDYWGWAVMARRDDRIVATLRRAVTRKGARLWLTAMRR